MAKEYQFQKDENAPSNNEGKIVFSKDGFLEVGGKQKPSEYISHDDFIQIGINKFIFSDIPFFKKFLIMKIFKKWKIQS